MRDAVYEPIQALKIQYLGRMQNCDFSADAVGVKSGRETGAPRPRTSGVTSAPANSN